MAETYLSTGSRGISGIPNRVLSCHCLQHAAALMFFFWLVAMCLSLSLRVAPLRTTNLWILVASLGVVLIRRVQRQSGDLRLKRLQHIWIAKLSLTLFLLYVGWIPQLDPASSQTWGYDPQRYYVQAQELVANNWVPNFVSLNYIGVLYYYGFLFAILGHNPVVPALMNAFATLIATLLLVDIGYRIKPDRGPKDWYISLALLFPEVLWYDVMTSRETLCMSLLTIMLLVAGRCLINRRRVSPLWSVLVVGGAAFGIGLVRTPMLIPAIIALALLAYVLRGLSTHRWVRRAFIIMGFALLIGVPIISTSMGSYRFRYKDVLKRVEKGNTDYLLKGSHQWSENSIGQLLIPDTPVQAVLFVAPRALLYLVAPLPSFRVTLSGLMHGSWGDWQFLCVAFSALLNITLFPLALASLIHAAANRRQACMPFVFHIPYWVIFASIVAGNHIIHVRYRVMAALLFCGCVWLGTFAPKRLVLQTYLVWFAVLLAGALFYASYKTFA